MIINSGIKHSPYYFIINSGMNHSPATHPFSTQAKDKARKEVEKARKMREPLEKRLAEDPAALATLAAEVADITAQIQALGGSGSRGPSGGGARCS